MKDQILIVDDEEINRIILTEILKNEYDILEAADGAQALDMLTKGQVRVQTILLDMVMPHLNGYEVLRILQEDATLHKIPVIVITAENTPETETKVLGAGAVDFISKPFNPNVVKARVANHLQLWHYNENLEEMVQNKTHDLIKTHEQMLEIMATIIEYRSLESGQHIQRTRIFSQILLAEMAKYERFQPELQRYNAEVIGKAVVLHDIGKVGIPDAILLKPDHLTDEEYNIMKTHTTIGARIIDNISSALTGDTLYLARCKEICRWHHEKWNGKGYPDGLSGFDIPFAPRVLSIVDVYDALISARCYKPAMNHEQAVDIIRAGAGVDFDPEITEVFLSIHERFDEEVQKNPEP